MKIHFSKKEYRLLLDMISIADWVMNSNHEGPGEINVSHKLLCQKIMSYAKEMESDDIIEFESDLKAYYPIADYEALIGENYIDPYDNDVFWEELIGRLAARDLIKKVGIEKVQSMEGIDRVVELGRIEDKYSDEFEENGLENIVISNTHFKLPENGIEEEGEKALWKKISSLIVDPVT